MHFTCRSFIGHPGSNNWSQYWENEPDDRAIFSSHGHLFGLINFISPDSTDISLLGHNLIGDIDSAYYTSSHPDIQAAINSVIAKPEYTPLDLSFIIAIIIGNQLNLVIFNSGNIILKRGQQISNLLSGSKDECVFVSGQINAEDQLFLTTDEFFKSLSWDKIKTFLSGTKIQDIEENFLAHLYSIEDQISLAGAYIQVHTEPVPIDSYVEPEPVEEPSPAATTINRPSFFSRFLSQNKPIFVSHQDNVVNKSRQKINIFVSIVLILCLCVSSIYGYRQNQKKQVETTYQQLKTELNTKLDNAQAIKNLNLNTALDQAKESKSILDKMIILKIHPEEISQYQQKISSLLSQTGSADNSPSTVFYDTSLIVNDPHFSQLVLAKNILYLFDSVSGRIDQLDISSNVSQKSTKNISQVDGLKKSQFIAESNGIIYLLKDTEIYSVDKNTLTSKIKITDSVKNFTSGQFNFWNSNLYLLSMADATIWKFTPNSTGFGSGQAWLKDGQRLPASPSSLAINGDIWVIGQNGALLPYTYGTKAEFKSSSIANITSAANLTTSPEGNLIAFSDANSSIYVFKKTGESVAHFNLGSHQISSLAIDPTSNSIFALCTDQKIYKISL